MTKDAEQLMAYAIKTVQLNGSFAPAELGAKIGLSKIAATIAARTLTDGGVLVLGFDGAAHFSPEFRKMHSKNLPKPGAKKTAKKKTATAKQGAH